MANTMLFFLWFAITMECRLEQCSAIKTAVHAGNSFPDTLRRIQAAWRNHTLSTTQVRHWFKVFTDDPTRPVKDAKYTRRPKSARTAANTALVQGQLQVEKRQSVRKIAQETGLSKDTTHRILKKDLDLTKIAPKFIPKLLNQRQLDTRLTICRSNIQKLEQDPGLLARLVATDESWVFTFDPRTKLADMQWCSRAEPHPTKALQSRSQRKTLLILFFDSHGTILTYFLEETVDSDLYIDSLRAMREAVRCKRPALWADQSFVLLQDNASPHTSNQTLAYFHSVQLDLWAHPQYSPDLSPCDYWAFPLLKSKLKGHRFQSLEDLKTAIRRTLRDIPVAEYQDCFDKLLVRYRCCVEAAGGYFEGQTRHLRP